MKPLQDENVDRSSPADGVPIDEGDPRLTRRTLLMAAGAAGGAALVGAELTTSPQLTAAQNATPEASPVAADALPPNIPPWTTEWGPLPSEYGSRSPFEDGVVRDPSGTSSRSPLADLHGIITPNSLFFERHHAGVPQIDPAEHRLIIHGMVDRPVIFTLDDIKHFPATSAIHFHECSGNTGSEFQEDTIAPTVQKSHGLVSATEWTGVPMRTILNEAGIQPGGTWLLCEGADAAAMTRSIPTEKAMADGLLVYGQNGEALRPEQGYPMRAIWPGYEGNSNIKWIRRIEVGNVPWETREETSKYTDLLPDGIARQFTFIMEAKSVITTPSGGQTIPSTGFREISGIAWSGRGKITMVEVSTDGGSTWHEAELQEPVLPICLTRFRLPWAWDGNAGTIQSRATDETGYVQPTVEAITQARGLNSTYHMNAIKTWAIAETGEVTNVYK
jgi:sulfane dehydrogenase subunit SoxC